jgi:hypothetical protein
VERGVDDAHAASPELPLDHERSQARLVGHEAIVVPRVRSANTAAVCTFHWEYSLDGQKTWIAALATPVAATAIAGLPPLATVSFRVSVTAKKATGAPCQPVSIIVH